jgi:phytanoyl-CoA hydroxylase
MLAQCPKTQTAIADGLVNLTRAAPLPVRSGGVVVAHPETELRDRRVWRKMWCDARANLARAAHVAIHRWSPDSPACA